MPLSGTAKATVIGLHHRPRAMSPIAAVRSACREEGRSSPSMRDMGRAVDHRATSKLASSAGWQNAIPADAYRVGVYAHVDRSFRRVRCVLHRLMHRIICGMSLEVARITAPTRQ